MYPAVRSRAGRLLEFKARINYKESPFRKRKDFIPVGMKCVQQTVVLKEATWSPCMHSKVSSSQAAKALPCHPCREEFALKSMRKRERFPSPVLKSSATAWDMRTNV